MSAIALPFIITYCVLIMLLAWKDYKTGLLPDRFTCPLLWSGLLFHVVARPQQLPSSVLGAIIGYAALTSLYWVYRGLRHKEGLGYGDVKFLAALGAWNGWQQLPQLVTLATGLALLFICTDVIIQQSGEALKNPLRFGPFLGAAGLVVGWQSWVTLPL
jgi:leader peptidase HopD